MADVAAADLLVPAIRVPEGDQGPAPGNGERFAAVMTEVSPASDKGARKAPWIDPAADEDTPPDGRDAGASALAAAVGSDLPVLVAFALPGQSPQQLAQPAGAAGAAAAHEGSAAIPDPAPGSTAQPFGPYPDLGEAGPPTRSVIGTGLSAGASQAGLPADPVSAPATAWPGPGASVTPEPSSAQPVPVAGNDGAKRGTLSGRGSFVTGPPNAHPTTSPGTHAPAAAVAAVDTMVADDTRLSGPSVITAGTTNPNQPPSPRPDPQTRAAQTTPAAIGDATLAEAITPIGTQDPTNGYPKDGNALPRHAAATRDPAEPSLPGGPLPNQSRSRNPMPVMRSASMLSPSASVAGAADTLADVPLAGGRAGPGRAEGSAPVAGPAQPGPAPATDAADTAGITPDAPRPAVPQRPPGAEGPGATAARPPSDHQSGLQPTLSVTPAEVPSATSASPAPWSSHPAPPPPTAAPVTPTRSGPMDAARSVGRQAFPPAEDAQSTANPPGRDSATLVTPLPLQAREPAPDASSAPVLSPVPPPATAAATPSGDPRDTTSAALPGAPRDADPAASALRPASDPIPGPSVASGHPGGTPGLADAAFAGPSATPTAGADRAGQPHATYTAQAHPHGHVPGSPAHVAAQMAGIAAHFHDRPVELTLSPEELGIVRMTLSARDGAAVLSVSADRSDTLDLMRRNTEVLERQFRDLGFDSVSFTFGDRADRGAGRQGAERPHAGAAAQDQPGQPGGVPGINATPATPDRASSLRRQAASGRIDLRL